MILAGCNLSYSGSTGVIRVNAYVTEVTVSGTTRQVRLRLTVRSNDGFSGARDGSYRVKCSQSGTDIQKPMYSGFTISGSETAIFDETFRVSLEPGDSASYISLSFSVTLRSPSAGDKTVSGTVTRLDLTKEPEETEKPVTPSRIRISAVSAGMGDTVSLLVERDRADCWHRLYYQLPGESRTLIAGNVQTLYSWKVPDLSGFYRGEQQLCLTVYCVTYLGTSTNCGQTSALLLVDMPRATEPVCPERAKMGAAVTVTLPRASAEFTHTLRYTLGKETGLIGEKQKTACKWNVPLSLAKIFPAEKNMTCRITCETRAAGYLLGTESCSIVLEVPDDDRTKPKAAMKLSPSEDPGGVFSGMYIRGITGVCGEFTVSSEYSRIKSCRMTVDGVTVSGNPAVSARLNGYGTVTVTGQVEDTRGYVRNLSQTISVAYYEKPRVVPVSGKSAILAERCNNDGAADPGGRHLKLQAGRMYTPLQVDGQQRNFCRLQFRYRKAGDPEYSEAVTLIPETDTESREIQWIQREALEDRKSGYTVRLEAVDTLGGYSVVSLPVAAPVIPLHIGSGGSNVAVGKYCDYSRQDAFEIGLTAYLDRGIALRKVFAEGSWAPGTELGSSVADADGSALALYSFFMAVMGGTPVWLMRLGDRLYGAGIRILCKDTGALLEEAEGPVTALYAVL